MAVFCTVSASFSTRSRTPVTRIVHNFLLRLLKRQSPEFPCAFSLGLSFLPAVSLRGTSLAFRAEMSKAT